MNDFPLVRYVTTCPLCNGDKASGLVACWPCFNRYDMRHGSMRCDEIIAEREAELGRTYATVVKGSAA